jgi:replicative DNA helicase
VSVAEIAPRGEEFERTPPHDLAAEQCVLGGMMLSKDAIADVLEVIKPHDYYRPAHQVIHDVILDLYGRGEPADAVTVAAELTRTGDIGRIGGAPYLHTLIASVPTAANAGYYARIVRERAILRRLVEVGTRIVQLGYGGDGNADELVDRAEAEIYGVTDRRVSEDYLPLAEIMPGALDEIEAIGSRGASLAGVPTGFADLDALTNGLHPGQMVVIAARPAMGKSALALDIARAAAVQSGLTAVLFSLEMSRNEITMRLLSAEARVSLQAMRTGQLGEDDWTRLARRMSEVVDAPLYIDDSPNMSMMEIRSKCRRLKQRHDLRLVVIDYLQLMSSPKRVENRQQEVSDLSRSLKLLAKELNVPVVALAQLNRGPEMRTDKRPLLADLRESGCLTARTRVMRADTNEEVSLGELLASGAREIPVWALDERLKYVKATMSHVFPTGRKETYALRLASGRRLEATGNHRFLTVDGWLPLAELAVGSRIAVPRKAPAPLTPASWPAERVILLAHLIGDGSFVKRQPIRYASVDEANLAAVARGAKHFGISAVRDEYPSARVVTLRLPSPVRLARGRRNPIAAWLDDLGLFGLRSHEKFVPPSVFRLRDAEVALFLRHLWATDGSVTISRSGRGGRIYYSSTSRRLLDDVAGLLRRFEINARIREATTGPHRPQFTLDISGREDQLTFLTQIGVHGARAAACELLLQVLQGATRNINVDTIPPAVWQRVRRALADQGMSHRQFSAAIGTQFCGSTLWKHAPSRGRLALVAGVLDDAELELLATNDVLWDEIVSIEPVGVQDVYDATVNGVHNFVANGIAVHNSIEQDADVVILLHREDAYERESPRAGEADLIVAKHRNGPTTTVTVAFQGHYSRFVDMAPI